MAIDGDPKRVLVVEDEMVLALLVEDFVAEIGHEVVASAAHLDQALALARTADFDLAVLDVNLAGKRSFPVADILADRKIPFVFASGYGVAGLPDEHRDSIVIQKPFEMEELASALEKALAEAA